ncbi:RNI-like protein [Stipitochalara longipes BDJ]|nr:RNI-like protein [Stipitochalara longipes BDJ]
MAFAPPSYQAAAYRRLWIIIAPYVQLSDLYAACLVCRQWHQVFAPLLWGAPASRFGNDSNSVYLSLTRFKRLLARTRLDVRRLAHTLHIPPAQADLYDGPQAGWLRDILDRLPCLQALIVSNLAFFDHEALKTIHQCTESTKYPLRLLIASDCENTTATSLASALCHFPDLIYLDLSSSHGARNPIVLRQIGALNELRILKLRNCGLRDDDIDYLTFTPRLRSLDVSKNFLTERGLSKIIDRLPPANLPYRRSEAPSALSRRYSGVPLPAKVIADGLEDYVAKRLTSGLDGYLIIEEGLPSTFTHLWLASNYITIDELNKLLNYPSLQQLDCGSLNLSQKPIELLSPSSPGARRYSHPPPEIEILSPALFTHAFRNLRSLRIHHSVITNHPFSGKEIVVEEQCFELHSEDLRFELDSTEVFKPGMIFELDDTSVAIPVETDESIDPADPPPEHHATFESPDDVGVEETPVSPISPIAVDRKFSKFERPREYVTRKTLPPPLSISEHNPIPPSHAVLPTVNIVPAGPETFRYNYRSGEERHWHEALANRHKPTTLKDLIEEATQRRHRTEARERHPGRFKPSMLPNLKTLTLTDVPSTTHRRHVPDSLALFIHECGEEEELARLEELAHHQDPNQIPQWHLYSPQSPLKLQRLVLEMTSHPEPLAPPRSPRHKRESFTKSSTEDADSELFMQESQSDFSFFGEDDGGLLVSEGRIDRAINVDGGLIWESGREAHALDVVGELSAWRREKKRAFECGARVRRGAVESALLGHWRGEIKVVKEVIPGC